MPVMLGAALVALACGIPAAGQTPVPGPVSTELKSRLDALIADGSYNDALALIERVERQGALPPDMQLKRGIVLMQLGDTDEARRVFERLRDSYPQQAAPYVNLAAIHARSDDLEGAREALAKAASLAPKQASHHESLGKIHLGLAWKSFKLAADLDPNRQALLRKNQVIESLIRDGAVVDSAPKAVSQPAAVSNEAVTAALPARVPTPTALALAAVAAAPSSGAAQVLAAPALSGASQMSVTRTEPSAALASAVSLRGTEPVPRPAPAPTDVGVASAPEATASNPMPADAALCPAASKASCLQALAALEAWRLDWRQRSLTAYSSHYLPTYLPAGFKSRGQWLSYKKRVFDEAGFIDVSLKLISVKGVGADRFSILAEQRYSSAKYRDQTKKRFVLLMDGGQWRITSEQKDET
ncbi:tetratricopeptide repeat protein [Curvibacter microcysteis]|nr:tetratricopeptide repeat protein [Curvibacter sp. HBC28]